MEKKKPRGKPFEKGNTAGMGRPKLTEEEKVVNKLTRRKFQSVVREYLDSSREDLVKLMADPNTPTLDLMVVSVMSKAIKTGDEKKINWFLEQLFGKLKETKEVNLSGHVEQRHIDLSKLSDEDLLKLSEMADKCEE